MTRYKTCYEAITGELRRRGLSMRWLATRLGKSTGSFYQTIKCSHGMRLADEAFRLLGLDIVSGEVTHADNQSDAGAGDGRTDRRD